MTTLMKSIIHRNEKSDKCLPKVFLMIASKIITQTMMSLLSHIIQLIAFHLCVTVMYEYNHVSSSEKYRRFHDGH